VSSRIFHTATEQETIDLGRRLASEVEGAVLLIGNLGAGKTTLTKGIVAGRSGISVDEVSSPTFTLIHQYGDEPPIYHVDLYRLDEPREVESLGLDELFSSGALVLLEWAERFPQLMPGNRTEISLRTLENEEREITVSSLFAP
jgi:tRNA threonylcarbamoyladenosine biosynthesis protein TsaE